MKRASIVGSAKIRSLLFSAILQIGDNYIIAPNSKVLATQREVPVFRGNEGNFASFPIFSASIPQPIIKEHIHLSIRNENPVIQVDIVDVIGVSTASVIQIGANRIIQAESRTKHIRQLLQRETETTEDAGSVPF